MSHQNGLTVLRHLIKFGQRFKLAELLLNRLLLLAPWEAVRTTQNFWGKVGINGRIFLYFREFYSVSFRGYRQNSTREKYPLWIVVHASACSNELLQILDLFSSFLQVEHQGIPGQYFLLYPNFTWLTSCKSAVQLEIVHWDHQKYLKFSIDH